MVNFDKWLFFFFNETIGSPALDFLFTTITDFSLWRIPLVIAAAALIICGKPLFRIYVVLAVIAVLFGDLLGANLKEIIARPRPFVMIDNVRNPLGSSFSGGSYSMPSNHAINTFAATTMLVLYFWQRWRWWAGSLFIVPVLVALSRVYVGVHYPSDIVVGAMMGIGSALFVHAVFVRAEVLKIKDGRLIGVSMLGMALIAHGAAFLFRASVVIQEYYGLRLDDLYVWRLLQEGSYAGRGPIALTNVLLLGNEALATQRLVRLTALVGFTIGSGAILWALFQRSLLTASSLLAAVLVVNLYPFYQTEILSLQSGLWLYALVMALFTVVYTLYFFDRERVGLAALSLLLIGGFLSPLILGSALVSQDGIAPIAAGFGPLDGFFVGLGAVSDHFVYTGILAIPVLLLIGSALTLGVLQTGRLRFILSSAGAYVVAFVMTIIGVLLTPMLMIVLGAVIVTALSIAVVEGLETRPNSPKKAAQSLPLLAVVSCFAWFFLAAHYYMLWQSTHRFLDRVTPGDFSTDIHPWFASYGWGRFMDEVIEDAAEYYHGQRVLASADDPVLTHVLLFHAPIRENSVAVVQDGAEPSVDLIFRVRDPRWSPHYYRIRRKGVTYREFLAEPRALGSATQLQQVNAHEEE